MDFLADETASFSSPPRLPRTLRRRLSLVDCNKTPNTAEQIKTKLRLADLRRQEYYEKLSNKARAKPRSPSRCSSQEEDLGQRLEAKLQTIVPLPSILNPTFTASTSPLHTDDTILFH